MNVTVPLDVPVPAPVEMPVVLDVLIEEFLGSANVCRVTKSLSVTASINHVPCTPEGMGCTQLELIADCYPL